MHQLSVSFRCVLHIMLSFGQRMSLAALTFVSACLWPRWCQFCVPSLIVCSCDEQPSVLVETSTRTVRHSLVLAFGRLFFSKSCHQAHFRHHFRHHF